LRAIRLAFAFIQHFLSFIYLFIHKVVWDKEMR